MIELLAPAGNWDCARAAVENGADAIYFGLQTGFNARARAANFSIDGLRDLMNFLHLRGVRGYVTLNTLVFTDEIDSLARHAIAVAEAGADAVLVQDLGVAHLLRQLCPSLSLHASTQMTLTSAESLRFAEALGIERVVLPRELSVDEIRELSAGTRIGLEAFVHGALCVAYSGQCLTSESLGGRSANRGQCAQACRLPYQLLCDDQLVELGNVQYLLSPQDLAAHALLPDLLAAGVTAFKIEGRLKTAEYVANVTARYRKALDAAIEGRPYPLGPQDIEELELSFSRGFSPGWLQGSDHKMLVPGTSSAKRGICVGEITALRPPRITVSLWRSLQIGDGIVVEGDRAQQAEEGGRVATMRSLAPGKEGGRKRHTVEITLHREDLDFSRLHVGLRVWKTDDPQLTRRLRATFSGPDPVRKTALDLRVTAHEGKPLVVRARAASGAHCEVVSDEPLPRARKHPVDEAVLREKLGRLGGSVYSLRTLELSIQGSPIAPLSVLGRVRHDMVAALDASLPPSPVLTSASTTAAQVADRLQACRERSRQSEASGPPEPQACLHVLCRRLDQLQAIVQAGGRNLYCDFQDLREYRTAVATARQCGATLYLATPRIEKPGEQGIFSAIARNEADGVLVRNLGGLHYFHERGISTIADFSLNAANELTVGMLRQAGAARVTASYDLNRDQLRDLVSATPTESIEVVIHQHMPMFHMEHCVFCAVLSPGTNKTNCGRPCDVHRVRLRDRVGMEHPLHADVGCRNTLYNAVPQSSAEIVSVLAERGVRHFRVELLEDSPEDAVRIMEIYEALLRGEVRAKSVWQQLRAWNRVGVTRGTMETQRDPLAIL